MSEWLRGRGAGAHSRVLWRTDARGGGGEGGEGGEGAIGRRQSPLEAARQSDPPGRHGHFATAAGWPSPCGPGATEAALRPRGRRAESRRAEEKPWGGGGEFSIFYTVGRAPTGTGVPDPRPDPTWAACLTASLPRL